MKRQVIRWKGRTFVFRAKEKSDALLDYFKQVCQYLGTA